MAKDYSKDLTEGMMLDLMNHLGFKQHKVAGVTQQTEIGIVGCGLDPSKTRLGEAGKSWDGRMVRIRFSTPESFYELAEQDFMEDYFMASSDSEFVKADGLRYVGMKQNKEQYVELTEKIREFFKNRMPDYEENVAMYDVEKQQKLYDAQLAIVEAEVAKLEALKEKLEASKNALANAQSGNQPE